MPGSTPPFIPPPPFHRSVGWYPTTIFPLLHLSSSGFPPDRGFRGACHTPSCGSATWSLPWSLPLRSPFVPGPLLSPLSRLTVRISLILGTVPLMVIAIIWWGLLVLSWFPYCGVSLSLVHCWVS